MAESVKTEQNHAPLSFPGVNYDNARYHSLSESCKGDALKTGVPSALTKIAGSGRHRRQSSGIITLALRLGSFLRPVTVVWVGAHFLGKRKILGAGSLQKPLFSPPANERDQSAKHDYQHDKRNQEP